MEQVTLWQLLLAILTTTIASSGFWAFILKRFENKTSSNRLLLGLAHDRLVFLGLKYIERGWVTRDEYENLYEYLYCPYKEIEGNGTVKRIMAEIEKLPIHNKRKITFKDGETLDE